MKFIVSGNVSLEQDRTSIKSYMVNLIYSIHVAGKLNISATLRL